MKTAFVPCTIALLAGLAGSAFTSGPSLELALPVVVRTIPVAGATNVDPALTEVRVIFSKSMQDGGRPTANRENSPELTGDPRHLEDGRTFVLPVRLEPRKDYAIRLNVDSSDNFKDIGGRPAVPYVLAFRTTEIVEPAAGQEVNRRVSDFPVPADGSTPEGACAAWQRASANKDAQTISQLSLVPLDPADQENWYRREESRDAAGLGMYLQALADSTVLTVQTWRGDLANVVSYLPFPAGLGRNPYSARYFGRIDGQWKNLGEDRLPDLEAAKAGFEQKKQALWQRFTELKARATELASAPADKAEWMKRVDNFFQHNFRDVTSRESLEWGDVTRAQNGNVSIRYRYRARIWDKQTVTNDQIFTFESQGKFISVKDAVPKTGAIEPPQ